MMMNDEIFCGIVDQRKTLSLISSRDYCQRFSPSHSYYQRFSSSGFEPVQNLSSGLIEGAVVITTTPRRH